MSSIFDFEIEDEPIPVLKKDQKKQSIFDEIEKEPGIDKPSKESFIGGLGRQVGRAAARTSESVLGAPRAAFEFGESLIPEKLITKGAEKLGIEKPVKSVFEAGKKYAPYKILPTSQKIREFNEALFGEKVKPQNEVERKSDEVVSDFASLITPFDPKKIKLLKPFLVSLGGNLAAELAGKAGVGEKGKTNIKLGTFLLGSMADPKGAEKFKNDLYDQARQNRPLDATVAGKNLDNKINSLRSSLQKGGSSQSKTGTLKKLDELQSAIKNGKIEVEELEKYKTSINESLAGLFEEFKTNRPGRKAAKHNLLQAGKLVDETLTEYGKTNPKWESFYRPANEAHGAIAQSQKARNFIKRNYKTMTAPSALALFGVEQAAGPFVTGATIGTGAALLRAGEIATQISKSPKTLGKYYAKVLESALKEDAVAMRENLRKLEIELNKEED